MKKCVHKGGSLFMATRGKFSAEDKMKAVLRYTQNQESQHNIAEDYGVNHQTIRNWIRRYEVDGILGLEDSRRSNKYTVDTKQLAVEEYLQGRASQSDICKKYKIRAIRTLQVWIEEYNNSKENKIRTPGTRSSSTEGNAGIKIVWEGLPMKMVVTKALRIEVVEFCITNNYNYTFAAEKYGVSYSQVYNWVKNYEKHGEAGLEDRRGLRNPPEELNEIDRLKEENRLLKIENRRKDIQIEVLKKAQELGRR